jgi:hypothetical protein
MNPTPTVPLDQLSVDQQNEYINYIVDDPHTTVRKADSYLLRRLHTLALERGFDAVSAADVEEEHARFYAGLKNQAIHSEALSALVRFNNPQVIDAAIKVVIKFKEANRHGAYHFQFAGTSLATLALKIGARDEVVMAVTKFLSAAQHASVLGSCVGDQALVDRFDCLMPGTKMGREAALRQAIISDGKARTSPEWTNTYWIGLVTDRVDEKHRVIAKSVLESIIGSEINRGLFEIKQPAGAPALAASAAIPRDITHLLYVLTCVHGWRFPNDAHFYELLKTSDGLKNTYGLFGSMVSLKSRVLGKALKTACDAASEAAKPKSHGVALLPATMKRLGIVA